MEGALLGARPESLKIDPLFCSERFGYKLTVVQSFTASSNNFVRVYGS